MNDKKTLGSLFLKRCAKEPKRNALGWVEQNKVTYYNYKQYQDKIISLSYALFNIGLTPQDKISILSHTCKEWHFLDIACLCSHTVVVPIYPNYTDEEVEYIFNHSESKIICVENDLQFKKVLEVQNNLNSLIAVIGIKEISKSLIEQLDDKIKFYTFDKLIELGHNSAAEAFFEQAITNGNEEDIASIIYTSGTTGEPKGALITQKAFSTMLNNVGGFLQGNINEQDRSLVFLPLSHVLGRCDSLLHLPLGLEIVYAESIEKIIDNIKTVKPTIMVAVPRIFEKIYAKITQNIEKQSIVKKKLFKWAETVSNKYFDKLQNDLSPTPIEIIQRNSAYKLVFSKIYENFGGRVRFFVSGGAPLSKEIITFLRNANLCILEGYGLTETIAPCSLNPISKQIPGTVGLPIGDVKFKFADDGEILIKTEAMLSEYYKKPQETEDSIIDGWFHSGDIGELTPEGYLRITDRKKDIIITSGGKNVAPQKIENLMKMQPLIANFMVIGDKRKFLTAIIAIEKEDFIDHLADLGLERTCSLEELANHPEVNKLLQSNVSTVNEGLASFETIKKFYISPIEFTVETGMVTPSLKLKKKVISTRFKDEIEEFYS